MVQKAVEVRLGAVVVALAAVPLIAGRSRGPVWLALLPAVAVAAGAVAGTARLDAIDGGALRGPAGRSVGLRGYVVSVPRRTHGEVRVEVVTKRGRVAVIAPEPVPDLSMGEEIRASGPLVDPEPFYAPILRRHGIAMQVGAEQIEPTGGRRAGAIAFLDAIRGKAEVALDVAMRPEESALARGFVLGEDDRIAPETADDFKRAGLTHILAVSGQNVVLLAMLAMPLLALSGLGLRGRLVAVLILIAIYVPVAGAGPSIQRAGAMGAAGVMAALAGRPRARAHAVLLAAFATLLLNPRVSGDIGWQLSFAAVVGIFLWSARIAAMLPGGEDRGGWRWALAEGTAMSIAATLATAPLMAAAFERVSVAALPANLLALPAIAPAMWLGMLSAAAGQVGWIPVGPLNAVNQLLLAYVEQVARWCGSPSWAVLGVSLRGVAGVGAACALVLAGTELSLRALERRRGLRVFRSGPRRGWPGRPLIAAALATVLIVLAPQLRGGGAGAAPAGGLRVSVLDVGQGDAILLSPAGSDPVLVDGGPPGDGIVGLLRDHGVESLAAAIVTHVESDHEAGVLDALAAGPVARVGFGEADPPLLGSIAAAGAEPLRLAEGDELDFGELRLEVLWPPRDRLPTAPETAEQLDAEGTNPNDLALVLLAEWRHFSMLLTADAEAESVPVDPGAVDVLKVAHHGSVDAGLDRLLDETLPDLAVISVGAGNTYGHPTEKTLGELSSHEVPVMRTDRSGTIEIEAGAAGWRVEP